MDPLWMGYFDPVAVYSILFTPMIFLGVVLAILGAWRKESPKTCWRFGLALNSAWIVFVAVSLLWHRI
jgi:hypothetical protein